MSALPRGESPSGQARPLALVHLALSGIEAILGSDAQGGFRAGTFSIADCGWAPTLRRLLEMELDLEIRRAGQHRLRPRKEVARAGAGSGAAGGLEPPPKDALPRTKIRTQSIGPGLR